MSADYAGEELALFAEAENWKSYWTSFARPYIGRRAIEVGAGLGANSPYLAVAGSWQLLEPDPAMAARLRETHAKRSGPVRFQVLCGTLDDLGPEIEADTIIYADVLEHIADDRAELAKASARLVSGGHLIVLAPAHGVLFSPFDTAVGHYRRYTKASLTAAAPASLTRVRLIYLDSLGLALSLANRMILRKSMPTRGQIDTWDRNVIPASRILDRASFHCLGKSVLGIWRKGKAAAT